MRYPLQVNAQVCRYHIRAQSMQPCAVFIERIGMPQNTFELESFKIAVAIQIIAKAMLKGRLK
jgi:hypothetical protein